MKDFSERLQYLMDFKKFNQQAVADGAGVHRSRVSVWVNKKVSDPRRETLQKLSDFFGCSIDWLADGTGEPFPNNEPIAESLTPGEKLLKSYGKNPVTSSVSIPWKNKPTVTTEPDQCTPDQILIRFQHIFEFLRETYGDDVVAINDFMARLDKSFLQNDPDYLFWLEERRTAVEERLKKQSGECNIHSPLGTKSVNE